MSEELRKQLHELDKDISKSYDNVDPKGRVSFEYSIGPPVTDAGGVKWYPVKLFIAPKSGFDLANIKKVAYLLHETFRPSEVAVATPQNQFALHFQSWGDFHAMVIIVFNSGEQLRLIRYLPIGV
jgi:YEATS family